MVAYFATFCNRQIRMPQIFAVRQLCFNVNFSYLSLTLKWPVLSWFQSLITFCLNKKGLSCRDRQDNSQLDNAINNFMLLSHFNFHMNFTNNPHTKLLLVYCRLRSICHLTNHILVLLLKTIKINLFETLKFDTDIKVV